MVPTGQTAWAGSPLWPWLPECTRFVSAISMFLVVLLEKHQVQLTQQNRAVPFNALEIILVRSVLAYTQELSLEKFNVARVFGAPHWYLLTSVSLSLHVPRIMWRQKDQDMPSTGSQWAFFLWEPHPVDQSSEAMLTYCKWKQWGRHLSSKLVS